VGLLSGGGRQDDHHAILVPAGRAGASTGGGCVDQRTCAAAFPWDVATGLSEAVEAQIREVREVLGVEAAVAGVDPQVVDAAVVAAAGAYLDARVHGVIGILVERQVRSALRLTATGPPGDDVE
jgi:hypothetical protein